MRKGAAHGPVHVTEAICAMRMIRKQTALVSGDGSLDDDERRCGGAVKESERLGGLFEISLLTDEGAHERIVVFQESVRLSGAARLHDELSGEFAVLPCFAHRCSWSRCDHDPDRGKGRSDLISTVLFGPEASFEQASRSFILLQTHDWTTLEANCRYTELLHHLKQRSVHIHLCATPKA